MPESMIVNQNTNVLLDKSVQSIFHELLEQSSLTQPGLFVGRAGILLFSLEYYRYTQDAKAHELIGHHANYLIENISSSPSVMYCEGVSGVAWALNYMHGMGLLDDDILDFLQQVDAFIQKTEKGLEVDSDFMYGTTGLANYFLDRGKVDCAFSLMKKVVNSGVHSEHGLYWESKDNDADGKTQTVLNLSMAHGSAAILVVLSKLLNVIETNERPYIETTMRQIIKFMVHARKLGNTPHYPGHCVCHDPQKIVAHQSRLSWCYGDMGIGLSFVMAGNSLDDADLIEQGVLCYENLLDRNDSESESFKDACFCHGPSGLCQMFLRMFFNTGNSAFKEAADFWMNETLKKAVHQKGQAGYMEWDNVDETYINSFGILGGIAGIGLSMLSYLNPECANWDRAFLLSK